MAAAADAALYKPRYTEVERVRRALSAAPHGQWQPGGDLERDLSEVIAAAESQIDDWCDGQFDLAAADATARDLQAEGAGIILTPAFATVPESISLLTRSTGQVGDPVPASYWRPTTFPSATRPGRHLEGPFTAGLWYRVVARWGWPLVPAQIAQAAALMSARLYHRMVAAPLGIAGTDLGGAYVARMDSDVRALLTPFMSASLV